MRINVVVGIGDERVVIGIGRGKGDKLKRDRVHKDIIESSCTSI
jgi:hypothetical protein